MKLREQYADDKTKINQAMMELYRREKSIRLGGCLPILVQIPVFIALYWVLSNVELRQALSISGIKDLSAPDLGTCFHADDGFHDRSDQDESRPPDRSGQVMMIMPFAFGVMFYFFPRVWFSTGCSTYLSTCQQCKSPDDRREKSRRERKTLKCRRFAGGTITPGTTMAGPSIPM